MMGIEKPDMEEIREVKLHLPVHQLLRLHAIRLLQGPNFSETVRAALGAYFDKMGAEANV